MTGGLVEVIPGVTLEVEGSPDVTGGLVVGTIAEVERDGRSLVVGILVEVEIGASLDVMPVPITCRFGKIPSESFSCLILAKRNGIAAKTDDIDSMNRIETR